MLFLNLAPVAQLIEHQSGDQKVLGSKSGFVSLFIPIHVLSTCYYCYCIDPIINWWCWYKYISWRSSWSLWKWRPIPDQIFAVVETIFFHSVWRYHLNTCRREFYYECDWNGARIIVLVQQTKTFSTLTTRFGHLEGVCSHKSTRYE